MEGPTVPSTGAPGLSLHRDPLADPPPWQLPIPGTLGFLSVFKTKPQLLVSPYLYLLLCAAAPGSRGTNPQVSEGLAGGAGGHVRAVCPGGSPARECRLQCPSHKACTRECS